MRDALASQGFGVVSEIDVATNLYNALGIDRPPLKILGACSPMLAHNALELDPSFALLLPCNVVLEAVGGRTRVQIVDPRSLMDDPRLAALADEAAGALEAALSQVTSEPA